MEKVKLEEIFKSFDQKQILILGDVMIDSYLWGKVDRISPEAPIPVVSITKREERLGGAANVALNIKALGAVPIICSVIGNDDPGKSFIELLRKRSMTAEGILIRNERKTTKKSRIISSNQHLLRVDEEISSELSSDIRQDFVMKITDIISKQDIKAIIFQDYDKGVIDREIIDKVTKLAANRNIATFVDPKKKNFSAYKNVTLFKPNLKELTEGLKIDVAKNDFEGIFKAVKEYQYESNIDYLLITLSEQGIFISHNGQYSIIPAEIRQISDVSGAGDTVISVACMCMIAGAEVHEIATISNIAGGLVCEKSGVVPIDKKQLQYECESLCSD